MRGRFLSGAMGGLVGGVIAALIMAMVPAGAANGDPLRLGQVNGAMAGTVMRTGGVRSLKIVNNRPAGVPLELHAKPGQPPMRVNTARKVVNLNADMVDGKSAGDFIGSGQILFAAVTESGALYGDGNAVSATRNSTGNYSVVFNRSTAGCSAAAVAGWSEVDTSRGASQMTVFTVHLGGSFDDDDYNSARVLAWRSHQQAFANTAFHLILVCKEVSRA